MSDDLTSTSCVCNCFFIWICSTLPAVIRELLIAAVTCLFFFFLLHAVLVHGIDGLFLRKTYP